MKGKFKQQSFGSLLQDEEYAAFQWLKLPGRDLSAGSGGKAEPCPACRDPGAAWPLAARDGKLQVYSWHEQGGTTIPLLFCVSWLRRG